MLRAKAVYASPDLKTRHGLSLLLVLISGVLVFASLRGGAAFLPLLIGGGIALAGMIFGLLWKREPEKLREDVP